MNLPTVLTCIDFKKEFDYIHRGKMAKVLKSYGIHDKLIKAINKKYANSKRKYTHLMVYMNSLI